jgi:uncharacterized protein involved in exopolysaccharide biosynthesis
MTRSIPAPNFPDELDLARYFELVRHRWLLILLCGVLGAGAAYIWTSLQPTMYVARADVALVRTGTIVSFDPKIRTVSDVDPNAQAFDVVARRRSLVVIGTSQDLANQVIQVLGARLPDTLREPGALVGRISVANDGDLITIQAVAENPELAAMIANAWARAYEARVNELFSASPVAQGGIQSQAAQAKLEYDASVAAVTAYLNDSPIEALAREQASLTGKLDAQVAVDNKLEQLEADVQALRVRLETSGTTVSPADELTQILIQTSAFNNGSDTAPFRLDLAQSAAPARTREELLGQLDALAKAIQQRRATLRPEQQQALYSRLNSVQAQLAEARQELKELEAARDLAWTTYQTLNSKIAEVRVSAGIENQWVRIASSAVAPRAPIASRALFGALIGGAVGLALGFVLALIWDFRRARGRAFQPASH